MTPIPLPAASSREQRKNRELNCAMFKIALDVLVFTAAKPVANVIRTCLQVLGLVVMQLANADAASNGQAAHDPTHSHMLLAHMLFTVSWQVWFHPEQ